MTVEQNYK